MRMMKLPFSLPVQQNFNFVGRQAQLKHLHEHLSATATVTGNPPDGSSRRAVLHGLGGAGKTQLSVAYAHAHREEFDAVLWIDGSDEAHTLSSYQIYAQRLLDASRQGDGSIVSSSSELLSRLRSTGGHKPLVSPDGKVSTETEALPNIAQAVVDFLQSGTELRSWLLVFDNVDSLDGYPLSRYLPQRKEGKIIITTRLTDVIRFGSPVEVGQIEEESAIKILLDTARLRVESASGM